MHHHITILLCGPPTSQHCSQLSAGVAYSSSSAGLSPHFTSAASLFSKAGVNQDLFPVPLSLSPSLPSLSWVFKLSSLLFSLAYVFFPKSSLGIAPSLIPPFWFKASLSGGSHGYFYWKKLLSPASELWLSWTLGCSEKGHKLIS